METEKYKIVLGQMARHVLDDIVKNRYISSIVGMQKVIDGDDPNTTIVIIITIMVTTRITTSVAISLV